MNKNTLYGLIAVGIILFGFTWYNSKQNQKYQQQKHIADSIQTLHDAALAAESGDTASFAAADSAGRNVAAREKRQEFYGESLSAASQGEEKFFTVENDLAKFTFTNKGGRIASVELKKYKKFDGGPVVLFEPQTSTFDLKFFIQRGYSSAEINTGTFYFTVDSLATGSLADGEPSRTISMKLHIDQQAYVEYLYVIPRDSYMIDFSVNFVGMQGILANQSELQIDWHAVSPHLEKSYRSENRYSSIFYGYAADENPDHIGMSESSKGEDINARLKWVAFKQQFFSSVLIAKGEFQNATLNYDSFKPESGSVKDFSAKISVPFNVNTSSCGFNIYYGPNKYSLLKSFDLKMQKLVPLGGWIIGWVNRWIVIPVFDFLEGSIASFGLIIFLLTLLIKILTMPLTYKSYISQAKMRLVKPEIDELAKKFPKPEDAMKKQQATMELYKRAGINPLGGCIPMLIQFPILIAMFYFFPASIELRGESFLWANDLSSYDSILDLSFSIPFYGSHVSLFALLMAVSVFISSKLNYNQTASAGPQMAGMKFMMLYLMPVMMLLWFNDYASGLSYYYFLSNVITIGQTYAFRYAVDEKKLHEKMRAKAASKKPRKKSKWRERYEEMLKEQQRQARKR